MKPCSLCGQPILDNPSDPLDRETDEHVPAKQFYPHQLRSQIRKQLWKVPSHERCNASYKPDEEYFYHRLAGLVGVQNQHMGQEVFADLRRRAKKPQSKVLIRQVLKEARNTSPGGIILPPGHLWVSYDVVRIQNVACKVAQCLFYKDHGKHMPKKNCVHIELCENFEDLQPVFMLLLRHTQPQSVYTNVFQYWYFDVEGQHHYALLFWEAFMFCLIFENPATSPDATASPPSPG